jgi:hypothetical protein
VLLLSLFFAPHAASASETARVVLLTSGDATLARKVQAEAEHVGILVVTEHGATPAGDATLLGRHEAVAVIQLISPERVRIHVAASGEHGAYETLVERSPADGDGFAVRVVEQLRGRLVELRLLAPDPESDAAVRATTAETPAPAGKPGAPASATDERNGAALPGRFNDTGPTLGIALGGGATLAAGGLGGTPSIALGLRVEPVERVAATLHALLPLAENDVVAPEGEASVKVSLFLAELGYRLAPDSFVIQPELGAGAGFVVLPMEAETSAPREAHTDQLVAGVYFLSAGAGVWVAPWLRLRGSVRAGLSAPRPVIVFADREAAAWGRGFVAATLEAEVQVPLSGRAGAP